MIGDGLKLHIYRRANKISIQEGFRVSKHLWRKGILGNLYCICVDLYILQKCQLHMHTYRYSLNNSGWELNRFNSVLWRHVQNKTKKRHSLQWLTWTVWHQCHPQVLLSDFRWMAIISCAFTFLIFSRFLWAFKLSHQEWLYTFSHSSQTPLCNVFWIFSQQRWRPLLFILESGLALLWLAFCWKEICKHDAEALKELCVWDLLSYSLRNHSGMWTNSGFPTTGWDQRRIEVPLLSIVAVSIYIRNNSFLFAAYLWKLVIPCLFDNSHSNRCLVISLWF